MLHAPRESVRLRQAPKPNVGIQQQFQFFNASISWISMTGDTTSPVISMLSDIEPNQSRSSMFGDAGITSAIGLPRLVTRSGIFVLSTSSSSARHFALNSEIAISWIGFLPLPSFTRLLL